MPAVEIKLGDMFDGPSDLVVVPCSTVPTITPFVEKRLAAFRIPRPVGRMRLGEVRFEPLVGAEQVAAHIAFAASVEGYRSTEKSIEEIGEALGRFACETPGARRIAAPLLGAGAGHLPSAAVLARLKAGFLAYAPEDAVLAVFVLHEKLFRQLARGLGAPQPTPPTMPSARSISRGFERPHDTTSSAPIRVLMSYTKTSAEHAAWVKSLATHLRSQGIDARLDTWHLRLGMDVAQWMCNELDLAERVLLICNEEYARRADGRHGGVGWEIRLIQGDLLMRQNLNPEKYIAIVRTARVEDGLPTFLRSSYYLAWPPASPDEADLRETLVRNLHRQHEEAPPLGRPETYVA